MHNRHTAPPTTLARPWHRRHATPALAAAWTVLGLAHVLAACRVIPWLPEQLSTLLTGGCVAATVVVYGWRTQDPVRVAHLEGILFGQALPKLRVVDDLPAAVGDATVVTFPPGRRPAPRHR